MRGQPLWRLALVVAVFVALAVPLWRPTRPAAASASVSANPGEGAPPAAAASSTQPGGNGAPASTTLRVTVTLTAASDWTLRWLDQTILAGTPQGWADSPDHSFTTDWTVPVPAEGLDLVLRATPAPPPPGASQGAQAVRVMVVTLPDGQRSDQTFWTQGAGDALAEVITVPAPGGIILNP